MHHFFWRLKVGVPTRCFLLFSYGLPLLSTLSPVHFPNFLRRASLLPGLDLLFSWGVAVSREPLLNFCSFSVEADFDLRSAFLSVLPVLLTDFSSRPRLPRTLLSSPSSFTSSSLPFASSSLVGIISPLFSAFLRTFSSCSFLRFSLSSRLFLIESSYFLISAGVRLM